MTQKDPVFVLLGPLQMSVDGMNVPVGTPKQRAVLAALLINRNRPLATTSLISAVWGEDPPSEARASLHAYVSNLRRLISTAGAQGRQVLENVPPGYRINVADDDVDLGRFIRERIAGTQAAAEGEFQQAGSHFSAALAEWRGAFLEDLREFDFVETFAVALVEDKIAVHAARAQAEIACGRSEAIIGDLEALVAEHRYREPLWAQLMTAYYLAQRQTDALDAYQRLKAGLAEDLGIDPDPALRDLHELILRQAPLDVRKSARATATETMMGTVHRASAARVLVSARLKAESGRVYPLVGAATRIGRQPDNDIVLTEARVSRRHAVIIDTGAGFVINDAGSANGIELGGRRIRGSATLRDGDEIGIGGCEFVFEIDA
jgi:DNA-binding SARP family transcriptional activator